MVEAVGDQAERRPGGSARLPSFVRAVGYGAALVLGAAAVYAVYAIRSVLFLFLIAMLMAAAIEPLVLRLRRGPFSRGQGILIVYTAIMLVIAAILVLTVPIVIAEASGFRETLPRLITNLSELFYGIDDRLLGPTAEKAVEQVARPPATAEDQSAAALAVGLSVVEAVFAAITVFVVAYYWLTERVQIKRAVTSLFPRAQRQRVGTIWNEVEEVLGGWVRGQLVLMLFIGVAAASAYTLIGLKYALVLGIVAGLLEVVPLVGPYLGAIPAILVALTQDVQLALWVALFNLVIQLLEGYVLVPRVMSHTVGVSSLTVVLGLLVGAALGGVPGALVAVPLAAVAQVVLKHLLMLDPEAAPQDAAARAAVVQSSPTDPVALPVTPAAALAAADA
jgi:predicted PurR-regulated permease PerM